MHAAVVTTRRGSIDCRGSCRKAPSMSFGGISMVDRIITYHVYSLGELCLAILLHTMSILWVNYVWQLLKETSRPKIP